MRSRPSGWQPATTRTGCPELFAAFMTTADAAVDGREALTVAPSLPLADGTAPDHAVSAGAHAGQAAHTPAAVPAALPPPLPHAPPPSHPPGDPTPPPEPAPAAAPSCH